MRKDVVIRDVMNFHGKILATPQLANTQDIAARIFFSERGYRFKEKGGTLTIVPLANPNNSPCSVASRLTARGPWSHGSHVLK